MKKTPQELARKRAVEKRMAWRAIGGDLRSPSSNQMGACSPAHWLSDEILEANTPKMVTVAKIRRAVRLANAAPALLAALERLVDDMTEAHADELSDNHGGDGPDCSYCRNIALAQAAIAKAKGSTS